jgi:hypothetical protein
MRECRARESLPGRLESDVTRAGFPGGSGPRHLDFVLDVFKRALDEVQNLRKAHHRLLRQGGHIYRLAKSQYVATVLEGLSGVLGDVGSVRSGGNSVRSWVLAGRRVRFGHVAFQ